jgi:hypothetical protein
LKASNFAADVPPISLEIHSVPHSVEALPVTNPQSIMTLHFTPPQTEVVLADSHPYTDISVLGDNPISYDLKLTTVKRVKLSISFDSSRVDELQAVQFLKKL